MADTTTETKAQKVERLKREKYAWARFDEIKDMARQGRAAVTPEWAGTYLRSWGIYTQGDGVGVIGGKGGEGKSTEYFMVRIRIPNGLLTSAQTRAIAGIADRHARGIADITVRQNIQLHWVTVESLPELIETLWSSGLTTIGACGDVARNVTGCPLAGFDAHEFCDASPSRSKSIANLAAIRIITTCRASLRCPSPAAARGAIIPRSTTSASRQ